MVTVGWTVGGRALGREWYEVAFWELSKGCYKDGQIVGGGIKARGEGFGVMKVGRGGTFHVGGGDREDNIFFLIFGPSLS